MSGRPKYVQPRSGPVVVDGMRDQVSSRPHDAEREAREALMATELPDDPQVQVPSGELDPNRIRIFQSKIRSFRITVQVRPARRAPDGTKIPAECVDLQFREHIWRSDDPVVNPADLPTVLAKLDSSRSNGIGSSFWDLERVMNDAKDRQRELVRRYLAANPKEIPALMQDLGRDEFVMPPPPEPVPIAGEGETKVE